MSSKSPHLSDLQYAIPVFLIPGLSAENMTPLIQELMAPVFCADLPSGFESAAEAAKYLIMVIPIMNLKNTRIILTIGS